MNHQMKVVFIGGLTNGKIVFDYLEKNKFVDLSLVITYPDGSSKPRHIDFPNQSKIIKSGKANLYLEKIKKLKPDLIMVAGWSELLDDELLKLPSMGVVGFHPSKLPQDRGRSVLAWQIEDGYTETALTMFYYNDIPDGGDIIGQDVIFIEENDYINDILNKTDKATLNLMRAYFSLMRLGIAPRRAQSVNEGNFRRLRTSQDSKINWNTNAKIIYNKIRAISHPYPGAEGTIENLKYKIYKAEVISFSFGNGVNAGTLVAKLYDGSMVIKTRDGFIRVTNFELLTDEN